MQSARVDGFWNKREKRLNIKVRHCSAFTVYFTDELVKPGEEFHLFINDIPYHDLVDPDSAPKYPRIDAGTDPLMRDELRRMRLRRAKVKGWTPDFKFAIDEMLRLRDRELVLGATRRFDLTSMKKGLRGRQGAQEPSRRQARRARAEGVRGVQVEGLDHAMSEFALDHRVRIVTAAALFDGHDAAINIMRRLMQRMGAEVIHLGHNRSAAEIVDAAICRGTRGSRNRASSERRPEAA